MLDKETSCAGRNIKLPQYVYGKGLCDEVRNYQPLGFSRLILTLAKLGFGRGRMKLLFAQLWGRLNRSRSVDIRYYGLKFRLKPRDNTIDSKMLFGSKRREETELKMISHYLDDGGVFVDIGANIGYYTLNAALLGAEKVIAIEQIPKIVARQW